MVYAGWSESRHTSHTGRTMPMLQDSNVIIWNKVYLQTALVNKGSRAGAATNSKVLSTKTVRGHLRWSLQCLSAHLHGAKDGSEPQLEIVEVGYVGILSEQDRHHHGVHISVKHTCPRAISEAEKSNSVRYTRPFFAFVTKIAQRA